MCHYKTHCLECIIKFQWFDCTDEDECYTMEPCDENAACINEEGSFTCVCNDGYYGNGTDVCEGKNYPHHTPLKQCDLSIHL